MECTLLPQGWTAPKKTLVPAARQSLSPTHSAAFANPEGLDTSYLQQQRGPYFVAFNAPASSP